MIIKSIFTNTKLSPTICDFIDKTPMLLRITYFIEQLRVGICSVNKIYLRKSEDSNIRELCISGCYSL